MHVKGIDGVGALPPLSRGDDVFGQRLRRRAAADGARDCLRSWHRPRRGGEAAAGMEPADRHDGGRVWGQHSLVAVARMIREAKIQPTQG